MTTCKTKLMISSALGLLSLMASNAVAQVVSPGQEETAAEKSDVIVTGTRTQGLKVDDSAAPVQVIGAEALRRVGQPDLVQALAQTLPSIQAQASGIDQANLHPEIKLRGLNPNHTLILINGKRRHGTANIVVTPGNFTGAAAADISLIPEAAIDHIEVLQDGAAAQYGTDAIAGVVNIILRNKRKGGSIDLRAGKYYAGDGNSYDVMGTVAFAPTDNTFLDVTAEHRYSDFTFRGDLDPRVVDTGVAGNGGAALLVRFPNLTSAPNYPYVSRQGNPKFTLNNFMYNAGWDITPNLELYSFGTYSRRTGRTRAFYRLPTAARGKGSTDIPFPLGFSPEERTEETDYAVSGGLRGDIGNTTFDLSSTYGRDKNQLYVDKTANLALYYDTSTLTTPGFTPTTFYNGSLNDWQWTNTLDLTHKFDIGLATPLNVAAGIEYRRENYTIGVGEPASYYKGSGVLSGGTQAFFGYSPSDAGSHSRDNFSQYVDINLRPVPELVLDGALRHEHYSDFGDATVWKITGRYDVAPEFAIRGTASTGFRAPTLAEEYYSGINVNTASILGIFPANSEGARFLGVSGLKPEKSRNYSLGFVARPAPRLTVTVDGYSISLRDRIVQSANFDGFSATPGGIVSPSVLQALNNAGVPVAPVLAVIAGPPAQFGFISIQTFLNGIDTRTQGIDAVVTYNSDFGNLGRVDWSIAANHNKTEITKVAPPPSNLNPLVTILDDQAKAFIYGSTPKWRVTASALWNIGNFSMNLRESYYGSTVSIVNDLVVAGARIRIPTNPAFITDLDLGYEITRNIRLSIGANNLFDKYPPKNPDYLRQQQFRRSNNAYSGQYPIVTPFSFQGGYYYARASFNW